MTAARRQREGSLTEDEVGVIRNLLARGGYKNQDILGLVNTVRRLEGRADTNGGRVSDVKTGKPRYKGIKPAPDQDTDAFIARAKNPAGFDRIDTDPLRADVLAALFPKNKGDDSLNITETDRIECKESFGEKHFISNCIRAIVAFANNKGGYIAFGVKDGTWEITGINASTFRRFDRRKINRAFRAILSCGIDFDTTVLQYGGKSVGIMYIRPAKMKPVMFIRQDNGATEGHIYYRYQGENRLIGPSELQQIIEERIRSLSETILTKHIQNILSNGIENSAVLNLDTGEVDGKAGSFVIDEELLPQISFVKEGEFVEKSGAPALKLIGEIKSAAKVVATKTEPLTTRYPYSWREMMAEVKKQVPGATPNQINAVIKAENMKENKKYAAYNFRNKKHADDHKKTGNVPSVTPSIYNQAAVDFVVKKLKKNGT
ncbi:MAG: putative DNA binding domain-containing protein [Rhodospirillales bacterium]|nr:putative DNA binding domain-containing protein [Rhodospirillales bacterium]